MVDQGGSGGAYENGGFNPNNVYNNDVANAAVESIGKTVGASLLARTKGDLNKEDISKRDRLEKRTNRIQDKMSKTTDANELARKSKRLENIASKKEVVESRVEEYNKSMNPTLPSRTKSTKFKKPVDNSSVEDSISIYNKQSEESQQAKSLFGNLYSDIQKASKYKRGY